MSNFVLQEVDIQEVINEMVRKTIEGVTFTSSCRPIGNVNCDERPYTVSIMVSQDEDNLGYDDGLPYIEPSKFKQGKGIVKAPLGIYKSAVEVDKDTLEFPEEW